ncbi:hypothetical protein P12x_000857 [Tundrisphaera lichenicola]|uniref:hypothetical protein n=1 Tax=Tundrisphaera lichenicola TaxID=2029860 RepID=UPI003EBB820C
MASAVVAAPAASLAAQDLAPRVGYVQFQPLTGRVGVTFTGDLSGIDPSVLTNPANYSLVPLKVKATPPAVNPSRPGVGVVLIPTYKVTGVSLTPPQAPGDPQYAVVVINNNQPLRPGTYRFKIKAAGIVNSSGVALEGAYRGLFPSGNGHPGTNFVADLTVVNNTVLPAAPVLLKPPGPSAPDATRPVPVFYPTTQEVLVKIVGNNNPQTRLLGGGNARVVALPGQFFPGTFRPAGMFVGVKARGAGNSNQS